MSDDLNPNTDPGQESDPKVSAAAGPETSPAAPETSPVAGPEAAPNAGHKTVPGNNSNARRKTLVALVVAFLLIGGGIFTFFIFQGLGDLKGDNNGSFSYGFAARNILMPLSNYFSLGDNDAGAGKTAMRPLPPGVSASLLDGPSADVSDWMAKKGAASDKDVRSAGSAGPAPGRTAVPRMGGGLGGIGGGGGGGSKSSSDNKSFAASKFVAGSDAGNVKMTGAGGKGGPGNRSGTLNALSTARASLSEGLKSGSAMEAKSKWDQGFGLGSTGKKSGNLAYGKAGLVGLDHIKSGDIADLKTTGANTLKTNEPKPEKDEAATAKDAKAKENLGADAAKEALTKAVGEVGNQAGARDPKTGKPIEPVPPNIIGLATTPPPEGSYCAAVGPGCPYQDTKVVYTKRDDGKYVVRYEGNLGNSSQSYEAAFEVDPNAKTPTLKCAAWADNYTGDWKPSGGAPPGASGCP